MINIRIGVVTEGITDQVVLRELLPAAIANFPSQNIIDVQPNTRVDRTSCEDGQGGGWTNILKWCLKNHPDLRRQMIAGGGLFESSRSHGSSLDGILILIDSDVCENKDFQKQTDVSPSEFNLTTASGRSDYMTAVLEKWLWPDGAEEADRTWTILAAAVDAIEAWLLAGIVEQEEPENLRNVGIELLKADYLSRGKTPPEQAKKMPKKPARYKKIASRAAKNIHSIISTCPQFATLLTNLRLVTQSS